MRNPKPGIFADETETDAAIRECQKDCEEFVKATERANVQVRKEELERREKLSRLFQAGEPSDQELRESKTRCAICPRSKVN